jgi:hypothetical protein
MLEWIGEACMNIMEEISAILSTKSNWESDLHKVYKTGNNIGQ